MSGRPRLRLITGCTAAGKTAAAIGLAERQSAEIVSCDSLLFYRGMDVGTAKPSREELARVPHHLIDVAAVDEPMDIVRYVGLARAAVDAIAARGRPVIVVGGSGFYLKSFLAPVTDDIAVSAELRAEVDRLLTGPEGLATAVAELHRLNPAGLGALDGANPRRVARALERCRASGLTLAEQARRFAARPSAFADWDVEVIELTLPPEELNRRIDRRVDRMLAAGLVEEVRRLRPLGLERNPSAARAIGYRETLAMLDGTLAAGELAAAIAASTRALVKKQRTWFRTQLPPHPAVAPQSLRLM